MPTKKERIEYLESEAAGLNAKVAELIAKVEELEKKLANSLVIPLGQPTNVPAYSIPQVQSSRCPNCNAVVPNGVHACWYVNPNRHITITTSNKTGG